MRMYTQQAYDRRGVIPNVILINERPGIVDTKRRIGDRPWTGAIMISTCHRGALVTLIERKSSHTVSSSGTSVAKTLRGTARLS